MGKRSVLSGGDPAFEPFFWINEMWSWHEVTMHYKNLPKFAYNGPGIMTDFLKEVIKKKLEMFRMNHEQWVTNQFTEEDRVQS